LRSQLKAIPGRFVTGCFWHQGAIGFDALSRPDPPPGPGRYHTKGGVPTWYCSTTEQAAWAELFRHLSDEVSPFEIRRRVACVQVTNLKVLDLTNRQNLEALSITHGQLIADDMHVCQVIAGFADGLFEGILGPSAALAGDPSPKTLAVFPSGMQKLEMVHERVRSAPPRLADLLTDIRIHRDSPLAVIRMLRVLAAEGSEKIRRRRQRDPVELTEDEVEAGEPT
jgi:hypothetical protein